MPGPHTVDTETKHKQNTNSIFFSLRKTNTNKTCVHTELSKNEINHDEQNSNILFLFLIILTEKKLVILFHLPWSVYFPSLSGQDIQYYNF